MQGSIQKRVGKRGVTWTAVVNLGRDPVTGKRKQKRLTVPMQKEAQEQLTKTLHEVRSGTYLEPSDEPPMAFLTSWLDTLTVRPGSMLRYQQAVKQRLGPGLGDLPLAKLTPQKIQAYNTGMLERLGNETVRLDFQILKAALDSAVAWGMLVRNPCTGVKAPRRKRSQMQVWTPEQVRALQRATEGEPCQEIWRVALGTAMRMGEILALRWSDVDLEKRVAQVTRTHYTGPEGRGIGDVKTAAGRRNIALAASCVQSLKARRVQVRPENEDDLI